MTLYKYHAVDKYALSALVREEIWATNPKNFRDPFDCAASLLLTYFHPPPMQIGYSDGGFGGFTQGGIMEDQPSEEQNTWIENMGVYCLSACNKNRLMWGHYADHFRGFCLEYTFDDKKFDELVKVKYRPDKRPPLSGWPENQLAFAKEAARYKAKDWCYEHEYRSVFECGDKYYPRPATITGVIFGTRCKEEDKTTINELLDTEVQRRRLILDRKSYALKIEEDNTS